MHNFTAINYVITQFVSNTCVREGQGHQGRGEGQGHDWREKGQGHQGREERQGHHGTVEGQDRGRVNEEQICICKVRKLIYIYMYIFIYKHKHNHTHYTHTWPGCFWSSAASSSEMVLPLESWLFALA